MLDDSGPSVLAVLVTHGVSSELLETIDAIAGAELAPDSLVVAGVGIGNQGPQVARKVREVFDDRGWVVEIPQAKNFGSAVRQALTSDSVTAVPEYLWLLHDDAKPHKRALGELLEQMDRGGSVAAVGPKQVAWGDKDKVLEVGIEATRGGRRLPLAAKNEIDQGQYDDRTDVLAVGSAGLLVRGDVWEKTRGFDPHLGPYGDGLEYGRRLRRAGYRVMVAPRAIIEHKKNSFVSEAYSDIREAQLYNWLLTVPFIALVFLVPALAFWSALRFLGRLVTRSPRLAGAETLAYMKLLGALPSLGRGRRRLKRQASIPASALAPLESTGKDLRRRRRSIRKAEKDLPERRPDLGVLGESARVRHLRSVWGTFAALLVLVVAASVILWSSYYVGLRGGNWGNLPSEWNILWDQAWSLWTYSGNGSAGPGNPLLPLLAVISAPFALFGMSPQAFAVILLISALPLAFIGAWIGASVLTRSIAVRAGVSLLWIGLPPFTMALVSGSLGQVLTWVVMPLVFACLWRMGRGGPIFQVQGLDLFVRSSPADPVVYAGLGGLAMIVLASGAPGMVFFGALVSYLVAFLPRHDGPFWKRLLSATAVWVPAAIWVLPSFSLPLKWWFNPTADIISMPTNIFVRIFGLIALGALAIWGLGSVIVTSNSRAKSPWIVRVSVLVATTAFGVGVFLADQRFPAVSLWAVVCFSLVVAGIAATKPATALPRAVRGDGAKRVWLGTLVGIAGGLGVSAAFVAIFMQPVLLPESSPIIPKVAQEAQNGNRQARLLVVSTKESGVEAALWRGVGKQQVDLGIGGRKSSAGDLDLAQAIASLAVQPSDDAASLLAEHAIELILVPEADLNNQLREHLDTSGGLQRIGTTEAGTMWRVRPQEALPARVTLGTNAVPSDRGWIDTQVSGDKETLYLAESQDDGWIGWFDGQLLTSAEAGWRQAFEFPGGEGRLQIQYRPYSTDAWGLACGIGIGLLVLMAIPWRPRKAQWDVPEIVGSDSSEEGSVAGAVGQEGE